MPATGALTSRSGERTNNSWRSPRATLAVGLGERERVLGRGELGLGGPNGDLALLDRRGGDDLTAELVGAVVIVLRPGELRLELLDLALRLGDRRLGARGRGVVLRELGVELAAVEPRENLPGRDRVAVLCVDLDDRQTVDPRRHQRLFARDQRSRNEQPIDKRALRGGRHRYGRRLDEARRLDRRGADRGAARARGEPEPGERRERRRARRKDEPGENDAGARSPPRRGGGRRGGASARRLGAGVGRDRAVEQRLEDAHRRCRLDLDVEIRLQCAPLEQPAHYGEDDPRGEFCIRATAAASPLALAVSISAAIPLSTSASMARVISAIARIAARLGGDLDDHRRLLARFGEHMVAQSHGDRRAGRRRRRPEPRRRRRVRVGRVAQMPSTRASFDGK